MTAIFEFDFFIAYASADAEYARKLHSVLTAVGNRVFLDTESLLGGDPWPKKVKQAQQASIVTAMLISDHFPSAYFQQEEILEAIELAREEGRRRVVPLYLTGKRERGIPAMVKQLQGVFWEEGTSLLSVAQKLEATLKESKKYELHEVDGATVVIVTGCHFLPELFDRGIAYELKAAIDDIGRSANRVFLRSIVMGDIWFQRHSDIQGHSNVVSIGSAAANSLTAGIADQGKTMKSAADGRWQIIKQGNRWALFGNRAEDTHDAVIWFTDRILPGFLRELWS
ncbi:MAG: toll/interleukin-1 receptor domain-containing protein [Thermoanaerobaculia bacterium]